MNVRKWWPVGALLLSLSGLAGCGGDDAKPASTASAAVIKGDGAEVSIAKGLAPAGVTIAVKRATAASVAAVPAWTAAAGDPFAFTPHGTTFAQPVTVQLPYTGAGDVVLRLADENDTTWEIVDGATFANGVATFETTTFSLYIVASRCQKLCGAAITVCGATTTTTQGDCVSSCQGAKIVPPSGCSAEATTLYNCFLANTNAGQFDCANNALPTSANCPTEAAAVAACVASSTTGADATGSDATSTDAAGGSDATATDASATDAGATDAGAADTTTTADTTPAIACPCFDAAAIAKAEVDAKAVPNAAPGVSMGSGGNPTVYAGCFYGKGAQPTQFGDVSKINWVIVTSLNGAGGDEAYNAWFVAGDVQGQYSCMSSKGDSKAPGGPIEALRDDLTQDEAKACVDVLVKYKGDQGWTCGEQH